MNFLRRKKGQENPAFEKDDGLYEDLRKSVQQEEENVEFQHSAVSDIQEERLKNWDVFREDPQDGGSEDHNEAFYTMCYRIFKLLFIILLFAVVGGATILSRGTLLYAAANVKNASSDSVNNNNFMDCNVYARPGVNQTNTLTKCVLAKDAFLRPDNESDESEFTCLRPNDNTWTLQVTLEDTQMCTTVSIRWIWALLLMMITPYFMVFIRCFWMVCFKRKKSPSALALIVVFIFESINVVGLSMFVFLVLPAVDNSILALGLTTAVAFLPGLFNIFHRPSKQKLKPVQVVLDVVAFAAQVSALVFIPLTVDNDDVKWAAPVSLVLISFSWWENYIDADVKLGPITKGLCEVKKQVMRAKTKIYLLCSVWKIALTFAMVIAFTSRDYSIEELFEFSDKNCLETEISPSNIADLNTDWVYVWLVNFASALVAYFGARTAAKIGIQKISYALPLALSTPLVFGTLVGMCEVWNDDQCSFSGDLPSYYFYDCYGNLEDLFTDDHVWIIILWWLSQLWISRHVWFPQSERLAKTERLFANPLYEGVVFEQSLLHNRWRRNEHSLTMGSSVITKAGGAINPPDYDDANRSSMSPIDCLRDQRDRTPMVYICATMWHETENEMVQMLKSIFRLDIDQCARKNAQEFMDVVDPDYYEFEAHIFFDDAMNGHGVGEYKYKVNDFVKLLVATVDKAARAVHQVSDLGIPAPTRVPTPYGGQLIWNLPGGNTIVVHCKDKVKIRHKKRWSQVMYMYYFLGYRLWAHVHDPKRKQVKADNTFLLALDGDVDFQPHAMALLVDLMKKDEKMGAACGRIHPIGSGPMVWYQKFEYALGHWMQKATEHVLGCVLCSPGCFSLFRGSALMDDNVMRKYTTLPTEAQHYVQYDQGEDRWLCTLLLQQGYKVEYSAASDSYTYAPEGFNEFYNQRRRWTPSTMANILDLLASWKSTIQKNENISFLYIVYQASIFVSSILGTGTIFLMIVGALVVAVDGAITNWESFLINLVPLILFIIICFKAKSDTQLLVGQVLTTLYALVQMLVLVGIIIQIAEEGPCSPTAIFFFFVAGTFVMAAILHPQESYCVIFGMIYFLAIPSMYMLLMIYALCNLHVVSWGTREVKPTQTEQQEAAEKEIIKEKKTTDSKVAALLSEIITKGKEKGTICSLGNIFRCIYCPKTGPSEENAKLEIILSKLEDVESKVGNLETEIFIEEEDTTEEQPLLTKDPKRGLSRRVTRRKVSFEPTINVIGEDDEADQDPIPRDVYGKPFDEDTNPYWMDDADLGTGSMEQLPQAEHYFFKDLVKQYLFPLEKNKAQEERISMELLDLRNKVSFAYLLLNGIFIVTIFTLQANVDKVSVEWPCGQNLSLEPIGFLFLIFFGIILILQIFGMIVHRTGTFLHIMATTTLRWFGGSGKSADGTPEDVADAIELARNLVQLKDETSANRDSISSVSGIDDESRRTLRRQKTITNLARQATKKPVIAENLDDAFGKRFQKLADELEKDKSAEDIGNKIMGRRKTRNAWKSVRAIAHLQDMTRKGTSHPKRKITLDSSNGATSLDVEMTEPSESYTEEPPAVRFQDEDISRDDKFRSRCDSIDDHPSYEDPAESIAGEEDLYDDVVAGIQRRSSKL